MTTVSQVPVSDGRGCPVRRLGRAERRFGASEVVALDDHFGSRLDLAAPRVRDAVEGDQAVRAVAGQAQAAAAGRLDSSAQHGDEHAVSGPGFDGAAVDGEADHRLES